MCFQIVNSPRYVAVQSHVSSHLESVRKPPSSCVLHRLLLLPLQAAEGFQDYVAEVIVQWVAFNLGAKEGLYELNCLNVENH